MQSTMVASIRNSAKLEFTDEEDGTPSVCGKYGQNFDDESSESRLNRALMSIPIGSIETTCLRTRREKLKSSYK
jgi:hypothetical protein